jgi:predicted RNase H-like HicB family nuclease
MYHLKYAACYSEFFRHAEGETYLEALENIQDIIRIHLESRAELGTLTPDKAEDIEGYHRRSWNNS